MGVVATKTTNHATLKYLFQKKDVKPRIVWWVLLMKEFNLEVKDKRDSKNVVSNHLFRLENNGTAEDYIPIQVSASNIPYMLIVLIFFLVKHWHLLYHLNKRKSFHWM